jgi:hypothetical protein
MTASNGHSELHRSRTLIERLWLRTRRIKEWMERQHQMREIPADTTPGGGDLTHIFAAALAYFALVFATGFILGSVRVPLIEPRFGKFIATLIEAPIMIAAIIVAAGYVTASFALAGRRLALSFVGILAVFFAGIADLCVGLFLMQLRFGEQLVYLMTPAGLTYLLLLAIFAAMPLVGDLWRRRARRADGALHVGVVELDQEKKPNSWKT